MKLIKKIPLPMAGVALAMLALGNLVKADMPVLRSVLACLTLLGLIAKICVIGKAVFTELGNPVVAGSFTCFPMAIAILSTYASGFSAQLLWWCSLLLHAWQ